MVEKNIPCVVVHRGYKPYLKYNLEITSKNNLIFLIGDSSVRHLEQISKNIIFINIDKYEKDNEVVKFKNNFKNYNTQSTEIEWMNFERVFIMQRFAKENKFEKVFHIDSDNILLLDINNLKFEKELAYCIPSYQENNRMDSSIHCGLLNMNFFELYQQLFIDVYINKNKFYLIKEKIEYHEENKIRGGITDMTFYYIMQKLKIVDPQNLMAPIINKNGDEYIFMNNFNILEGHYGLQNFKSSFKKGIRIYNGNKVKDIINNKYFRIANIHFQGTSKKYLNRYTKFKLKY